MELPGALTRYRREGSPPPARCPEAELKVRLRSSIGRRQQCRVLRRCESRPGVCRQAMSIRSHQESHRPAAKCRYETNRARLTVVLLPEMTLLIVQMDEDAVTVGNRGIRAPY